MRITDYPLDTVFAINPKNSIDNYRGLQQERLKWLGLEGKTLSVIVSTKNPYHDHKRIPSPYTHIGYDLNQGRVIVKKRRRLFSS